MGDEGRAPVTVTEKRFSENFVKEEGAAEEEKADFRELLNYIKTSRKIKGPFHRRIRGNTIKRGGGQCHP